MRAASRYPKADAEADARSPRVTISRTPGEVSEELWLQLWLKWEAFEPYEGQPGELEAALAKAKDWEEWKRQQRAGEQNKTRHRAVRLFFI